MVWTMTSHSEMSLLLQRIGPVHYTWEQPHKLVSIYYWLSYTFNFGYYSSKLLLYYEQKIVFPVIYFLGAISTEGIPSLIKVLLPSDCSGLPVS